LRDCCVLKIENRAFPGLADSVPPQRSKLMSLK
jgi:hypothetical protein